MTVTDATYGVTFDPMVFHSGGAQLDAAFSTQEDVVLSARYSASATVVVTGPANEIPLWRVGFVQNVVVDEATAYYGALGGGAIVKRVLKTGRSLPLRDGHKGGPWQYPPVGGSVPVTSSTPGGGSASTRYLAAKLEDQPSCSFAADLEPSELDLEGNDAFDITGIRGSTQFQYWLLAVRGDFKSGSTAPVYHVLDRGGWGIIWSCTIGAASTPAGRVQRIEGSGSYTIGSPTFVTMQLGAPDINDSAEFQLKQW